MACKQAAMSWIFNGAGSFEKLPVQEDGPRTCHSERSEESQNECAEAKHIKIQDFSYLTTFHCNSIFALLLSFPKSLNFLLSPLEFAYEPNCHGAQSVMSKQFPNHYHVLPLLSMYIQNKSSTCKTFCHRILVYKIYLSYFCKIDITKNNIT